MNNTTATPYKHYSCPDCPQGGERWDTPEALVSHLMDAHGDLWTPDAIRAEVAVQKNMYEASR